MPAEAAPISEIEADSYQAERPPSLSDFFDSKKHPLDSDVNTLKWMMGIAEVSKKIKDYESKRPLSLIKGNTDSDYLDHNESIMLVNKLDEIERNWNHDAHRALEPGQELVYCETRIPLIDILSENRDSILHSLNKKKRTVYSKRLNQLEDELIKYSSTLDLDELIRSGADLKSENWVQLAIYNSSLENRMDFEDFGERKKTLNTRNQLIKILSGGVNPEVDYRGMPEEIYNRRYMRKLKKGLEIISRDGDADDMLKQNLLIVSPSFAFRHQQNIIRQEELAELADPDKRDGLLERDNVIFSDQGEVILMQQKKANEKIIKVAAQPKKETESKVEIIEVNFDFYSANSKISPENRKWIYKFIDKWTNENISVIKLTYNNKKNNFDWITIFDSNGYYHRIPYSAFMKGIHARVVQKDDKEFREGVFRNRIGNAVFGADSIIDELEAFYRRLKIINKDKSKIHRDVKINLENELLTQRIRQTSVAIFENIQAKD